MTLRAAGHSMSGLARWSRRDTFGQSLGAVVDEWGAADDRTIRIKLKSRFPLLIQAIAQQNSFIMPERVAKTDAFKPISENIGSDAKPDWTLLRDTLIEGAKRRLGEAESMMKDDPVGAWVILEKIVAGYKSTPVAKSANEMILKLKSNPKVALEVRARTALEPIRKLDTQLAGRDLSFDPRNPRFQQENAGTLKQLEDAIARLRKSFPESLATTEGQRIADHWLGKR